jgi:hypothetical protein
VANLSLLAAQQYGAGTGVGIRIWRSADPLSGPSNVVYRPRLINVEIARTQGWGLLVDDTSRNGQPQVCIGGLFEGLEIRDFQTAGIVGCTRGAVFLGKGGSRSLHFRGCNIKSFIGVGIRAKFVEDLSLKDCIVENGTGSCPLVDCEGCNHLAVRHCWFESISLGGVPFVRLYYGEYMSAVVEACTFRKKAQSPQPNDICAVQVDGVARGVHIAALELVIPGTASSGTGGHLRVTPASGLDPEALVGPCGLNDATPSSVAPRLRASIDSPRAGILNAAWRQRVLSITQQERDTLADLKPGDLIFNADAVRCEVFDGVSWRALW